MAYILRTRQVLDHALRYTQRPLITTSFGIQSAVLLHLTQMQYKHKTSDVLFIDTGDAFPETYEYAKTLTSLLGFHLYTCHADRSLMLHRIMTKDNVVSEKTTEYNEWRKLIFNELPAFTPQHNTRET